MALVKGVPDIVIYAGGAFAIYYFFIRGPGETFKEPILGRMRARTERERMLKAQKAGPKYT